MDILLYIAALFLLLVCILLIIFRKLLFKKDYLPSKKDTEQLSEKKTPCILCGTLLSRGERLASESYDIKNSKLVYIYGCPYCRDGFLKKKICPICKKQMSGKEYLVGEMSVKKNGKKHLTVSGCTDCIKR